MPSLLVLFEHAAGYALFTVAEFEEIGMLLPQLEESVTDLSRFNGIVKLTAFTPFKSALSALENVNAISEGLLPDDLQLFLDTSFPKSTKKGKYQLGVGDPKLSASITEALGISCTHLGAVPEIIRGIRHHFHNLVKGFTATSSGVAQLGLGHSYSRAKVKFNVHRVDNMIIQSIALLDQLDKDVNTFSMRIREWYSYHFPELVKIVPDNYTYARLAKLIKNRKDLTQDSVAAIEEVVMDAAKAQAVVDASKSSMGMDINAVDLLNIEMFATRVVSLADYRRQLARYLHTKMSDVAPNLCTLIGDQVGARLIAHAGSLTNLAKYPASTVQILGAEKALFRALKTRGNTPKYGLLYHSTFIGRAGAKNKGRISRYLANKCSIASRIDCFADTQTTVFGDKLRQQVEDRLRFYESGDIPRKNEEVMREAIEECRAEEGATDISVSASGKKKKKRKSESAVEELNGTASDVAPTSSKKKKKRKSESALEDLNGTASDVAPTSAKKKKKMNSESAMDELNGSVAEVASPSPSKKKKKKKSKDQSE